MIPSVGQVLPGGRAVYIMVTLFTLIQHPASAWSWTLLSQALRPLSLYVLSPPPPPATLLAGCGLGPASVSLRSPVPVLEVWRQRWGLGGGLYD